MKKYILIFLSIIFFSSAYSKVIYIGVTNTEIDKATYSILEHVFKRIGYNVARKYGTPDQLYAMLSEDEINMIAGAKPNKSQLEQWKEYGDKLIKFSLLIEGSEENKYVLISKNYSDVLDKKAIHILRKIEFSEKTLQNVVNEANKLKIPLRDSARQWMGSHPNTIEYWFDLED